MVFSWGCKLAERPLGGSEVDFIFSKFPGCRTLASVVNGSGLAASRFRRVRRFQDCQPDDHPFDALFAGLFRSLTVCRRSPSHCTLTFAPRV